MDIMMEEGGPPKKLVERQKVTGLDRNWLLEQKYDRSATTDISMEGDDPRVKE